MTSINNHIHVRDPKTFNTLEMVLSAHRHLYVSTDTGVVHIELPVISADEAVLRFAELGSGETEFYVDPETGFNVMRGWVMRDGMKFYYAIPHDVLYEALVTQQVAMLDHTIRSSQLHLPAGAAPPTGPEL